MPGDNGLISEAERSDAIARPTSIDLGSDEGPLDSAMDVAGFLRCMPSI